MTKNKKKSIHPQDKTTHPKGVKTGASEETGDEDFDFGGFPKNVSLKKNIGCGG